MKKKNDENLNKLLADFFDAEEAGIAAENIISGENILDSNPAPEPSPALLAVIKHRMATAARARGQHWVPRYMWQFAAAAAAIVVVVWAGMALLQKPADTGQLAQASESFWQEQMDNTIESQIEQFGQMDSDAPLITLEANGSHETAAITEMADELTEIGATFWEG
jgi:hypothetical protein